MCYTAASALTRPCSVRKRVGVFLSCLCAVYVFALLLTCPNASCARARRRLCGRACLYPPSSPSSCATELGLSHRSRWPILRHVRLCHEVQRWPQGEQKKEAGAPQSRKNLQKTMCGENHPPGSPPPPTPLIPPRSAGQMRPAFFLCMRSCSCGQLLTPCAAPSPLQ